VHHSRALGFERSDGGWRALALHRIRDTRADAIAPATSRRKQASLPLALSTSHRNTRYPRKSTTVPLSTIAASFFASQLVSRMQPCDMVFPTFDGSGVP
jgi:hypothetical protein